MRRLVGVWTVVDARRWQPQSRSPEAIAPEALGIVRGCVGAAGAPFSSPRRGASPGGCTSSSGRGDPRPARRQVGAQPFLDLRDRVGARAASRAARPRVSSPGYARTAASMSTTRIRRAIRAWSRSSNGKVGCRRQRHSCSSSTSRTRTTTAACSRSAPTAGSTSAWATEDLLATRESRARTRRSCSASC